MLPTGANLQKIRDGKKTYAITPQIPGGFIKPDALRKYADAAEKYHGVLKLTSAQRIMITNLAAEDVEAVWSELGMQPAIGFANCVRSVKVCPGSLFCKRGKQDSVKLGLELDRLYHKKEMPSRLKIGVAGCQNSCAEVHVKDIGLLGTDDGWDVYVGGSAGAQPRLADKIIQALDYEEALRMVGVIIKYYQENAEIERIGPFIDRIGLKKFKNDVLARFYQAAEAEMSTPAPKEPPKEEATQTGETLSLGQAVDADSIISEIIRVYPQTISVLRSFGMGCLGCPSATGEPLHKAAEIHGLAVNELVEKINAVLTK
ncbi:DUF1858 domain-containing protein [Azotosporobacter soli]|uniref:DUF1858 domain-containing protein n=1 Tax=Azotosporobacter soli TaxID=3055040 RepID=UPI0031FE88FB